jgi:hypothetical protein
LSSDYLNDKSLTPDKPEFSVQSSKFKVDNLVKSRKSLENVIPAPHQVRDKLQPVEDSDLSENPVNSITSGCRIKACTGLDPGSGMTVLGLFTSASRLKVYKILNSEP